MVRLLLAPALYGVIVIVLCALLVKLSQLLCNLAVCHIGSTGEALGCPGILYSLLHIGIDEDIENIRKISEYVVCAPAHKDCAALLCYLPYNLALNVKETVSANNALGVVVGKTNYRTYAGQPGEDWLEPVWLFICIGKELVAYAALFGGHIQQLFVVVGYAKALGELLAYGESAGAELSAYVYEKSLLSLWGTLLLVVTLHYLTF